MSTIYCLVLTSCSASFSNGVGCSAEVADIVSSSRRHNVDAGITGVHACHGGTFTTLLEGSRADVEAAYERIRNDPRHEHVRAIGSGPVAHRCFPNEPMTYFALSARDQQELEETVGTGTAHPEGLVGALAACLCELAASYGLGASATPVLAPIEASIVTAAPVFAEAEGAALARNFATALFSTEGRVLRATPSYAALFATEPEQIVGRRRRELAIGQRGKDDYEALWAAMRRGEARTVEYQAARGDGAEVWIRGILEPVMNVAGQLREVVEIAIDISEELRRGADERGQIQAINASKAVAHFAIDGTILAVNQLFLDAMGYEAAEIIGHHHRMFVDPVYAASMDYIRFWEGLAAGRHHAAEYKRAGKDGREVWLQATYSPIIDPAGRVTKIVKYATDITREKLGQAEFQWQVAAIHKSQAVVTFSMNGLILDANPVFLEAFGYELDEVIGRHHRMFVDLSHAHGADYAAFWRELGRGRHQAGQYRRLRKNGDEVWLQATYNPVFDLDGRPVKIIKYATVVTEEKLRQAEHQGQIAAIHKAQGVISFALDGTILDANDKFLEAVGYRLADIRGRHHRMFVPADEAESAAYEAFWARLAVGQYQAGEYKRIGKDGREIWLNATYNPILDLNGRPFRVIKYATDITTEKLRAADVQGQIAAIHKAQGVISFALDGTILDANDKFLEAIGYDREELCGRHHSVLVEADHAASADYAAFWETLRSGTFLSGLYRRVGKDGQTVWIQASYNPILDLNGKPFKIVKIATDVTANVAMSEAYEDAKRQAQHDAVTSLPNRVRLASFMQTTLAAPDARLVAFYIDLDRFKPINDTYGHQVGDRVPGEVADRLRRSLSFDQLAARVGGDEFVVIAPDLKDDEVEAYAQQLIDAVTAPICHEDESLVVGASVGIASAPADGTTPDELLRCADVALYRAKQGGRGTFNFFAETSNERLLNYRNLVEDIRRGLEEEQFLLEYQPRFDASGRRVCSVEALVRWNHPERGRLLPADFIGAAERSGLIVELGEWVLRAACRAAIDWPSIGVSVNVSPVQFHATDLVALAATVLKETGIEAQRLELEITEGVLLADAQRARSVLDGLKRLGVNLAMDDFGTGYSSLSSLRSYPFDVIKIDRQFIADMDARDSGREVVRAILSLSKALGLLVTAEGVETVAQMTMLTADACDELQGYLLAYPMAACDIATLLAMGQDETTEPACA